MLQVNEIQQRFSHILQTIGEAERACMTTQDTPPELKDCITKLSQESGKSTQVMQSNDQSRITEYVDNMEALSDDAKRVTRTTQIPANLETAVLKVHAELSDLKHKIH